MKVGSLVQIQDNNEWYGLYGIVKYFWKGIAHIFCVQKPCYLYISTRDNNIRIIKEQKEVKKLNQIYKKENFK